MLLKNLNIDLPYDPAIPWGYTQRNATQITPRHLHTHVYCSTIHNSQVMETTKMPHYQRMDQENMVFMHNGVLLSHEEE
jgi:predicted glutamine amidotransferase